MLTLIEGPAGGGKSGLSHELMVAGSADILLDVTELWAIAGAVTRNPDGRYPIRADNSPALHLARYLQTAGAAFALRAGHRVIVTTSRPDQLEKWQAIANRYDAALSVRTVDPGPEIVRARLSDPVTGDLSPECGQAISRWYTR